MRILTYSHNYGEFAVPETVSTPVISMLKEKEFIFGLNCSKHLRKSITQSLQELGWSGEIKIDVESGITITSMNDQIGLCLQTGNMSRFYADILKLQTLYLKDKAKASMFILPTKTSATQMGSNVANFDRLVEELTIFKHTITIPILVVGIEGEE